MSGPVTKVLRLVFLVGFFVLAILFNAHKPRVLILHSYNPDYAWSRDEDAGIQTLAKNWNHYSVTRHFMDTNRYPDKDWLRRAGIAARRAIDRIDPDVLIAVDDPAQELAAKHYVDHPRMRIVFAGINASVESYGYLEADNVTGIYEHKPIEAVKELVQALEAGKSDPKVTPRVLYLIDPSLSMSRDRYLIDAFDWNPLDYAGSRRVEDFAAWKSVVADLADEGIDYLLVGNYRNLRQSPTDPAIPSPATVMGWTEQNSPVPVIGVNVFNVEDGGAIAVGPSAAEQGIKAAEMTEAILDRGIPPEDLPFLPNRQYIVALSRSALARRGLKLPQVYENFARSTSTYRE